MYSLEDLDLKDKRVLVRVDFNVPLTNDNEVADDSRMQAHVPTITRILKTGGRPIIMAHFGRPKGKVQAELSLRHIVKHLQKLLGVEVIFVDDCIGKSVEDATHELGDKTVLMLENLRFYNEEVEGDKAFAEKLARNGDIYINDAFGAAHREHASTATIARYFPGKRAFGLLMEREITNVQRLLNDGKSPVTAIVGGAKVSSKIGVIENILPRIDHLVIGGGMAFTFIKAQGGEVGNSLVEDDFVDTAKAIMRAAEKQGVTLHLPVDSVNADQFSNDAQRDVSASDSIPEGYMGLDAGPATMEALKPVIEESKTILWNGPMGVFEFSNFENGTKTVAQYIANATAGGAFSLVGGGDSVAAIKKFGMADKVSYVSTGGGAMLEFLEGRDLPGIKAMKA